MSFTFFNKKKQKNIEEVDGKNKEITREDVSRLAKNAGHIIAMFEHVYPDKIERLKYVSALAGHACHQAVKANGELLVKIETTDGLEYYFGDAVNYYLLENPFCVLGFMKGYYDNKAMPPKELDIETSIKNAISSIGDNTYMIWGKHEPGQLYRQTKTCWDGIYNNMTSVYCTRPSEWPVLYAIVLQNIMFQSDMEAEETFFKALECALFISKMDDRSVKA